MVVGKISTSSSAQQACITAFLYLLSTDSQAYAGFDTSFLYPFTIVGKNGLNLRDKWLPHPETYLTVCVDGFPNWFMSSGPNSFIGAGALLAIFERQVMYAVQVVAKMQRERLKTIEVKPEAVRDFDEYLEVSTNRRTLSLCYSQVSPP